MAVSSGTDVLFFKLGELLAGSDFQSGLLSSLVILGLGVLGRFFTAKSKLAWGHNHQFWFLIPPGAEAPADTPKTNLVTRTVHVMNEGRAAAEGVEVHLMHEPTHFQLWPNFDFETVTLPTGAFLVRIPNVGPHESFSLEILQIGMAAPDVTRVRSKAGEAPYRAFTMSRLYSRPVLVGVWALIILGLFTALRLVFAFILSAMS